MRRRARPVALREALVALALLLAGCASQPAKPGQVGEFDDPFENTNRGIFRFNLAVDHHVLMPVAKAYRAVFPEPARDSIHAFFRNLRGPIIFVNDVLQGEPHYAGDTLVRFLLNSTIGLGGLVDVAGRIGVPYHPQDFGITFGVWGIQSGPYLVVPILGPSDPRDLTGDIAEDFGDPWNQLASDNGFLYLTFVRGVVSGIDQRSRYLDTLADLERTSLDYYATLRSIYFQRRAALIRHEKTTLPHPGLTLEAPLPMAEANPRPASGVISEADNDSEVHIK
ncbi:MAG TPA: VacJ family lipoprotein [Stellaceae bacterium]|nr:VacJ family lipoprotein [Stellaceae bacterium]